MARLNRLSSGNDFDASHASDPRMFPSLRQRQREAFKLTGWTAGFLWGPPGTGKTHTLGALLATYLIDRPSERMLLLSSNNAAVDQVLLSVDRALETLQSQHPSAAAGRRHCARIGTHFRASSYTGREHLVAADDVALVRKLTDLEASKPDPADAISYAGWKVAEEKVRGEMRAHSKLALGRSRLAALTTTGAAFRLDDLRSARRFDLLVFDEASQVSVAYAAGLAPLAARTLIVGDPQQLAPIVQTDSSVAERWLGRSFFDMSNLKGPDTCRLNEQSRMAAEVCRVVSGTFYDGDLRVAADCLHDRTWRQFREVTDVDPIGSLHAARLSVSAEPKFSQKYGGWIRYESAEAVTALAGLLAARHGEDAVLILTPFRAQRALIRTMLGHAGLRAVSVTTVHRAQGSECHTVIFDPVDGAGRFVRANQRLLTVAISRAQARLVVAASETDRQNPVLRRITDLMAFGEPEQREQAVRQLREIALLPDFPLAYIGSIVAIANRVGRLDFISEQEILLIDTNTAAPVKFKTNLTLPGYAAPPAGKLPSIPFSAKQWADYGGAREQAFRRASEERVLLSLEAINRRRLALEGAGSDIEPPIPPAVKVPPDVTQRGSTPEALVRARMREMARAPIAPTGGRPTDKRETDTNTIVGQHTPSRVGVITTCEGNGGGIVRTETGQRYIFAFVDLSTDLKLKGIRQGLSVRFDERQQPIGGSLGRAGNVRG